MPDNSILPRLVSFSGYATAGKDAAADLLVEHNGYKKTYMSKYLEKALMTLDPYILHRGQWLPYSSVHGHIGYDESKKIPEVRRLLQMLGTEVGRNMFGEYAWVNLVFNEIGEWFQYGESVCVTGIRYQNELEQVKNYNGVSVWIHRDGVGPVNDHSSDNSIRPSDCDIQIWNDGTLDELYEKLYAALIVWGEPSSPTSSNVCHYTKYWTATKDVYVCKAHGRGSRHNIATYPTAPCRELDNG